MQAVAIDFHRPSETSACERCAGRPDEACRACNARRRHAVRLTEGLGLSVTETAARLDLPVARVERLLEEEADRRSLAAFRSSRVDNALLRERFRRRRRADLTLTSSELARRVGSSPIQVERWLGLTPTAAKTDRRG